MFKNIFIFDHFSILQAVEQIEKNKEKAVFVVDKQMIFKGVIADGDIRRYILKMKNNFKLTDKAINILNTQNIYLQKEHLNINQILEAFKNTKINIIPILDKDKKLVDYITKQKFNNFLLQNKFDISKKFNLYSNSALEQEIYTRPWGFYKSILLTKYVQCKIITVFPSQALSFQKHLKREEHWVVVFGKGKVVLEGSTIDAYLGKYFYIPTGCKHRIINTSKKHNLIFCEVQLGSYFGEDDIIRYEDKYNRS